MSPKSTWYYFSQELANNMNRELVFFLRKYNKEYSDLHPKCLEFKEPKKRDPAAERFPKNITNAVGQVCRGSVSSFSRFRSLVRTRLCGGISYLSVYF